MKLLFLILFLTAFHATAQRTRLDFNQDWQFKKDGETTNLDLPHDWSFQAGVSKNGTQKDKGGYYSGGTATYTKTFTPPTLRKDQELIVHFDGVYMDSQVLLNGKPLGTFPYGYLSFSYDLTQHLKTGENTITVNVDNSLEPSARWYHPCGIYAPVTLEIRSTEYIENVFITTPDITDKRAKIEIKANSVKSSDSKLSHQIFTPTGELVKFTGNIPLEIPNPQLWSPETPLLYTLVSQLHKGDKLIDEKRTRFGIRTIKWDPATGFHLNGEVCKLLGVCEHWEGGPVGGAWTPELLRWKLQLLKDMGCNSIRTSHHPFPPFFYDLCDEMGLMVMDEIFDGWIKKAPQDYGARYFKDHWKKDLTSWVIRDRNHPSIVIYSVGNETRGAVASDLVATIHELDPTRPVTSGHSGSEHMDVYGVNGSAERRNFLTNYPRPKNKAFIATEAPHTWQVRSYYRSRSWFRDRFPNNRQKPYPLPDLTEEEIFTFDWTDPANRKNRKQIFNSSYDNAMVRITARKNWEIMRDTPWYAGHFRWTGFDYPGEAGYVHGGWPFRAFMGGALDLAGFEKDLYYFYQSQWTKEPMVHLLPHWTHPKMEAGTEIPVWAYSNADEVELFLNGKSLGIDRPGKTADTMQCQWMVPWTPGTLLAIARTNGKEVARTTQTTAGQPSDLKNTFQKLDNTLVCTTQLVDDKGNLAPYADNRIYYHLDGSINLISHENGNPVDTENGTARNNRRAFMGLNRSFFHHDPEQHSSLTIASILGSRNGVTGNTSINIKANTHTFNNRAENTNSITIHYTIDGSTPTAASSIFKEPFTLKTPATVQALIISGDKELFQMTETFGPSEGLHWKTKADTAEVSENYLEAESAKISNGAKIVKGDISCVDFPKKGSTATFALGNNGIPGETTLHIHYATKGNRDLQLKMNGKAIKTLTFTNTGSWRDNWKTITTKIPLNSGANELTLVAKDGPGPTIDKILLKD